MPVSTSRLHQLFLLNVCLQLFDGMATYHGSHVWGEGNPLVSNLFPYFGVGTTLLLLKAKACGILVVLRRLGERQFVYESLVVLATVYIFFSFIPWMGRFLSLLPI